MVVDYILDIDFSDYYSLSDIEYLWSSLKEVINNAIELHVPKINFSSYKYPKWFTGSIKYQLNKLHSLRRR